VKRLRLLCATLLFGACTLEETSLLPTCPAGSVARGGLCVPVSTVTDLRVQPQSLDFGGIALGALTTRTFEIDNPGVAAHSVRVRPPDNSAFSLSVPDEEISIEAGQTLTVAVTFAPTIPDPVVSRVRIETCPGGCAVDVSLRGFGLETAPSTSVRCASLYFPPVQPGECVYDFLTCRNFAPDTIRITNAVVESDDGKIELSGLRLPITLDSGATDGLPMAFCPDQPGSSAAVVRVTSSDGATTSALVHGDAADVREC
jgi:hypothetical protein